MTTQKSRIAISFALACLASTNVGAITHDELNHKIKHLMQENQALQMRIGQLAQHVEAETNRNTTLHQGQSAKNRQQDEELQTTIRKNSRFSYEILDPTSNVNRKQRFILEKRLNGSLRENAVYVGGAITGVVNYQRTNRDDKFAYMMRRPLVGTQNERDVSEAVIHTAQASLTGTLGKWTTAHMELLYNPDGKSRFLPNTGIIGDTVGINRGYVTFGNLAESPLYASLGKMAVPFGMHDTVNPFTSSRIGHNFGAVANGLNVGFSKGTFNANVMAIQGGQQFSGANTTAHNTAGLLGSPDALDNVAADVNYTMTVGSEGQNLLVGASYIRGSAYCRTASPSLTCDKNNAAFDAYAKLNMGNIILQAEYAQTEHAWGAEPGIGAATVAQEKLSTWMLGGQYRTLFGSLPVDLSLEFSRTEAGPSSAEWDEQDQVVLGIATYLSSSVKLFGEVIHTRGYAPFLNNQTRQVQPDSESRVRTNTVVMGVNAAF